MRGEGQEQTSGSSEFLVHVPTDRVGLLTGTPVGSEANQKTIELPDGELVTGPVEEFRAATPAELEQYHRRAALIRPFVLPALKSPGMTSHLMRVI